MHLLSSFCYLFAYHCSGFLCAVTVVGSNIAHATGIDYSYTNSGCYSILDCICDFDGLDASDKLRMLHLSLDDSKCIYNLFEAISLPATLTDSFI